MDLSNNLISKFIEVTSPRKTKNTGSVMYGTVEKRNDEVMVKLDGSELLTPVSTTADVINKERVMVMIQNHTATIVGNASSPSARSDDVNELKEIVADKVSTSDLEAERARISVLEADNVTINQTLTAYDADIEQLTADNVTINQTLTAQSADISSLKTDKLDADKAELKYANIDFSNIGEAAMKYLYSESGLIKDIVIDHGSITGELVGVTISGDLIKGNTIVADKLVVKGEDGLYYKLNTDGNTIEKEQTDFNSLNGSVIKAKSITATKISVDDLVAFGATIGGFHISKDAIFSGVKESVLNTTRGIYLDNSGQISFGDSANYIRYFKEQNGKFKLDIAVESLSIKSSDGIDVDISDTIDEIKNDIDTVRDEITTLLRIESSRGTVFKNNAISTVLSVVVYHGKDRITDIDKLHEVYGNTAYIQWKWQRLDEETYGIISSADSRMGNGGFSFTLSPNDVDTKVTFMCELITD
nr:MAG TPA: hypothetical protein [Caudoviricetes sp.]